jgi:H+/gluconate symporter-like permease
MTPIFWTILVIIVATLLALLALYKKYNIIFALVVIRAFIGIIIKTLLAEVVYTQIIRTLGTCIAIITAGIGATRQKRLKN